VSGTFGYTIWLKVIFDFIMIAEPFSNEDPEGIEDRA
jgi:hypothetical protein